MLKFIKSFGLGLLYMILSPILLLILAGFALYGLYNFVAVGVKGTIRFFKGKPFFPPFIEDEKAEKILTRGIEPDEGSKAPTVQNTGTTNVYVQQNIYQGVSPNQIPQGNQSAIPPLPNARIPDIPGLENATINQINQDLASRVPTLEIPPVPEAQAIEAQPSEVPAIEEAHFDEVEDGGVNFETIDLSEEQDG